MNSDDLADLDLLDETGATIKMGELWADKTAVVAFLRHFG